MKQYTSTIALTLLLALMAATIGYQVAETMGLQGSTGAWTSLAILLGGSLLTLTYRGDSTTHPAK